MKYGTVCSGIEAPSVAWQELNWSPQFFSEIEAFPSALLEQRFPNVSNLGDMTRITEQAAFKNGTIELLFGGTPCQSFSVAGLRKGMADPRGNLALHFLRIADASRARWVLWENVPGVLSVNEGKDFSSFLGGLRELGYGFAFRTFNAQYFGVPQRRRRVFVVGYLGDWRRAVAVLFERHSLSRDTAPSAPPRENSAGTAADHADQGGGTLIDVLPFDRTQITSVENRSKPKPGDPSPSLTKEGKAPVIAFGCKDRQPEWGIGVDVSPPLRAMGGSKAATGGGQIAVATPTFVRRLTPRECERLQGFPDDYTRIEYNGKPAKDGPRYKAIGNSIAVPVISWIGRRIAAVEQVTTTKREDA